ncbi:MAG: hypothetical protein QOD27_1565 [Microbacteriaceae bacterium]|jgi:hypothetical protein|nr:hypothetical protein [Microbacteriaceae bacterium]MDQ1527342.1 hypothetical protein [Microbacteriaceae bacterium]MDQ1549907.1 hypothetical protein [Microbacteriaceae bacterium]
MKITVVRSGGIAGISTSWEVTIDDRDDRDSWIGLIEQLPWGTAARTRAEPDRYSYRIRCARRQVTLAEQQLTGPWRELVERVQDAAG